MKNGVNKTWLQNNTNDTIADGKKKMIVSVTKKIKTNRGNGIKCPNCP